MWDHARLWHLSDYFRPFCRVTGKELQQYESEKSVADEDVKALLQTSLKSKKKPKKKSKAAKKPENGSAPAAETSA